MDKPLTFQTISSYISIKLSRSSVNYELKHKHKHSRFSFLYFGFNSWKIIDQQIFVTLLIVSHHIAMKLRRSSVHINYWSIKLSRLTFSCNELNLYCGRKLFRTSINRCSSHFRPFHTNWACLQHLQTTSMTEPGNWADVLCHGLKMIY